eukprot:sb/3468779/
MDKSTVNPRNPSYLSRCPVRFGPVRSFFHVSDPGPVRSGRFFTYPIPVRVRSGREFPVRSVTDTCVYNCVLVDTDDNPGCMDRLWDFFETDQEVDYISAPFRWDKKDLFAGIEDPDTFFRSSLRSYLTHHILIRTDVSKKKDTQDGINIRGTGTQTDSQTDRLTVGTPRRVVRRRRGPFRPRPASNPDHHMTTLVQSDLYLTALYLAAPLFNGRINFPRKFLKIFLKIFLKFFSKFHNFIRDPYLASS